MDRKLERNRTINIFKGIACILVVINHYHHDGNLGNIEYVVSHLGVPFFFLVSGYYLFDSKMQLSVKRIVKKTKWIILLLTIHFSIYFLDNCIKRYLINRTEFTLMSPIQDLRRIITWQTLKSSLLWSTGIHGSAQWFLVALLQTYLLVLGFVIVHKEGVLLRNSCIIAVSLLAIHIFGRYALYGIGIMKVGFMPITETAVVRNAWFDGIPFVLLGVHIKNCSGKCRFHKRLLLVGGGIGLAASVAESYAVDCLTFPDTLRCVLYVGTIVAILSFFCYAVEEPMLDCKIMEYIGDKCSMLIYFIHPIVGYYVEYSFQLMGVQGRQFIRIMYPMIVISFSVLGAWGVHFGLKSFFAHQ